MSSVDEFYIIFCKWNLLFFFCHTGEIKRIVLVKTWAQRKTSHTIDKWRLTFGALDLSWRAGWRERGGMTSASHTAYRLLITEIQVYHRGHALNSAVRTYLFRLKHLILSSRWPLFILIFFFNFMTPTDWFTVVNPPFPWLHGAAPLIGFTLKTISRQLIRETKLYLQMKQSVCPVCNHL
jgi:hypothetical protein